MSERLGYMLVRLTEAVDKIVDWLSRLLEILPVRGPLDFRSDYGAPWRRADHARSGAIPCQVDLRAG